MSRKPWDRLPKEPPAMFERFVRYRDMDASERSLAEVGRHYGVTKNAVEKISSKFRWIVRDKAWRDHLDQIAQGQVVKILGAMNVRQMANGRVMQQKAREKLDKIKADDLTPLDVARLMRVGVMVERLAAGESTENVDTAVAAPVPETGEDRGRDTLRRILRSPAALRAALELDRALAADAGADAGAPRSEVAPD